MLTVVYPYPTGSQKVLYMEAAPGLDRNGPISVLECEVGITL